MTDIDGTVEEGGYIEDERQGKAYAHAIPYPMQVLGRSLLPTVHSRKESVEMTRRTVGWLMMISYKRQVIGS